jgi:hypothetical protein
MREKFPCKREVVALRSVSIPLLASVLGSWLPKPWILESGCKSCSCEIQAWALFKANSEFGQDAKGLGIPLETVWVVRADKFMENMLSDMAKGWVA